MSITVPSFAKINWNLEVLGKRSDGFHEILTVLQTISLADQITFELCRDKVSFTAEGRAVPAEQDNLVVKAAWLLRRESATRRGVRIHLVKRVPVGAGLGGGSSNAGITLLALNELWGCGLSQAELMVLGSQLGSDVPFFLLGGTALGTGRGEQLIPLADVPGGTSLLIVYPRFEVSTASAYESLNAPDLEGSYVLTRRDLDTKIRRFSEVLNAARWGALKNDLEVPVFSRHPLLVRMKRDLVDAGCEFGMLSGSGSALFAVSSENALARAGELLAGAGEVDTIPCHTLARGKYIDRLRGAGLDLIQFMGVE